MMYLLHRIIHLIRQFFFSLWLFTVLSLLRYPFSPSSSFNHHNALHHNVLVFAQWETFGAHFFIKNSTLGIMDLEGGRWERGGLPCASSKVVILKDHIQTLKVETVYTSLETVPLQEWITSRAIQYGVPGTSVNLGDKRRDSYMERQPCQNPWAWLGRWVNSVAIFYVYVEMALCVEVREG